MRSNPDVDDLEALDSFADWLEWPADARDALLAERLGNRPELLAQVQRLIAAEARGHMLPTEPVQAFAGAAAPPPERVGAYRLIEPIGEGGMGLVFRGERDDGVFSQTVAIKLIRRTLFSGAAAAQFASERQILARLRHPHIAQLFDGGITADGESYIVMELIEGQSIAAHCEAAGLSLPARMALLRDVCDAVQFAHQQLIVHADIKPSNVVIDPRHGVKLLDFGIASIVGADSSGPRATTPAFASPQQMAGLPPTPADDVFALGRLAGVLAEGLADAELAAVIARAIALDAADRYASASALSDDLGRWIGGLPVAALPASRRRNAVMFARRHWIGVGIAALALAALLVAVAVTTSLYLRAETARAQAEKRFAEVRQLSTYMLSDVTDALQQFPGTSRLRRDLADRGRRYLETLSAVPGAPIDMQLEVARGYAKTASILGQPATQSLGNPRAAKADLARAEALLQRLMVTTGGRADVALALSKALSTHAAIAHVTDNDPRLGEQLYRRACALAKQAGQDAGARTAQASCAMGLASLYDYQGRFADMPAALAASFAALDAMPANAFATRLARGNALMLRGDYDYYGANDKLGSLADFEAAAAVLTTPPGESPDIRLLGRLVWAQNNIASALEDMGRAAEGLRAADRGVAAANLLISFEKGPRAAHLASNMRIQRAVMLSSLHRFPEAIAEAEATLATMRADARRMPDDFELARDIPVNLRPFGEMQWNSGDHVAACRTFAQTQAEWQALARRRGVTGFDSSTELKVVQGLLDRCRGRV